MWNISNLLAFLGLNFPAKQQPVYVERRPTGAALRNLADPVQAARIEAAAARREERAEKLQRSTAWATRHNDAHFENGALPARLNPLQVNH